MAQERSALVEASRAVPDPRRPCKGPRRLPVGVLATHSCAAVCGCDGLAEVGQFARAKEAFRRRPLALPNGAPGHGAFRRALRAYRSASS